MKESGEKVIRKNNQKGLIFNVQRFSIEDGPGIRTTVFMKGCPLRCIWCHNPEGLKMKREIMWFDTRCIGARDCISACEKRALELTPQGMIIKRDLCDACGKCAIACPAGAIEIVGKEYSSSELLDEVMRDEVFYRNSQGGVTVSGGEPLMQKDFVGEFVNLCRKEGIHIALDTSAYAPKEEFIELARIVDLILLDLKLIDPKKHKELTGVGNDLILENAMTVGKLGKPVWVRTPIIPGCTDSNDNIRQIASFIKEKMPTVERLDLLAFNNTCGSKYKRLDMEWKLEGEKLISRERMEELQEIASSAGLEFVKWSGATKRKEE